MLIPERTVDSLLAFELIHARPRAIIWSPTNAAGSLDHELHLGGRRAILFECKGIGDRAQITVRGQQLADYVGRGLGQLLYLLPSLPLDKVNPWDVPCHCSPSGGRCLACGPSRGPDPRRSADRDPHVATARRERLVQPWFNHWAWCIPASRLSKHLGAPTRNVNLGSNDSQISKLPGAVRLCHLLATATPTSQGGSAGTSPTPPIRRDGSGGIGPGSGGKPVSTPGPSQSPSSATSTPSIEDFEVDLTEIVQFWTFEDEEGGRRTRPGSVAAII